MPNWASSSIGGLYSVPAWAPHGGDIGEVFQSGDLSAWFSNNSYAEWYLNTLKFEDSPTRAWHNKHYGSDFHYDDFVAGFNSALRRWNPADMATLFSEVNARYVVLTTKHHDGFTALEQRYPLPAKGKTIIPCAMSSASLPMPSAIKACAWRYIIPAGSIGRSTRRASRMSPMFGARLCSRPEFVEYSVAHWKELIDRYQPSIMWNDIGYPAAADLGELFAYYYNSVPDGVINDRFTQSRDQRPKAGEKLTVPRGPHFDYVTPEYATFDEIQAGEMGMLPRHRAQFRIQPG